MNNECGAKLTEASGIINTCKLERSHLGAHCDYRYRRTWTRAGYFPPSASFVEVPEKVYALKLTLTDLKVLSFFMSVSGVEQAPETAAKIDKALKEML